MKYFLILTILCTALRVSANDGYYWQQRAEYVMSIDFDVEQHRFSGTQKLTYYNNSPDTLYRVYYHLYFNAFQPGSMMDMRNRNLPDPDPRLARIASLAPGEIGYLRVQSLSCNGDAVRYIEDETILQVDLGKPIMPGESAILEMTFEGQVPVQVRRSGRDNREGVAYSMSQWYPKICEYDRDGWHPNPYIAREFYGVWGDFDVTIAIDQNYTIGGTGYLQNANEIGHGYAGIETRKTDPSGKLTWHFIAPNVHDFVWAADHSYIHTEYTRENGMVMHFFYKSDNDNADAWEALPPIMDAALDIISEKFGAYPYEQYSFIQGGDGGMEYPMATLITGNRSLPSLVGVSLHEIIHSWYQMLLGTNESLYAWMDEGFTSYAEDVVRNELAAKGLIPGVDPMARLFGQNYKRYVALALSPYEESMNIHADHYQTNTAYGVAAYVKGSIFLHQLEYIIGEEAFHRTMHRYYEEWSFKHPRPDDFIRVAEKSSGMILDWYKQYWINTTHTIDYGIKDVTEEGNAVRVTLVRENPMPMPVEVRVTQTNGDTETYYIPLVMMRGSKPAPPATEWKELPAWPWTNPEYTFEIPVKSKKVANIELDPDHRVADVNDENNTFEGSEIKS